MGIPAITTPDPSPSTAIKSGIPDPQYSRRLPTPHVKLLTSTKTQVYLCKAECSTNCLEYTLAILRLKPLI